METIMTRFGKCLTKLAAFTVVSLACGSALASTFSGQLPVGYSDSRFQIGGNASSLVIGIDAIGSRDPAACPTCNSIYTASYTVNLYNQGGTLLASLNEINFLYYNMFGSSHGIGAGPVRIAVPAGAATFEIVSQLSIAGLLGSDGHPLGFGNLNMSSDGSIAAATPIPSTLPLLATGLTVLGLFSWYRRRKDTVTSRQLTSRHVQPGYLGAEGTVRA
jgi:hypothetical protein